MARTSKERVSRFHNSSSWENLDVSKTRKESIVVDCGKDLFEEKLIDMAGEENVKDKKSFENKGIIDHAKKNKEKIKEKDTGGFVV